MTAASRVWPCVQCAGVFQPPLSPEIPHFLSPAAHLLLFAYISPLFFAYCQETLWAMVYIHQWNRNIAWRLVLVLYDPVFTRCSLRNEGATCKHQVQISFILLFCSFCSFVSNPFYFARPPGRRGLWVAATAKCPHFVRHSESDTPTGKTHKTQNVRFAKKQPDIQYCVSPQYLTHWLTWVWFLRKHWKSNIDALYSRGSKAIRKLVLADIEAVQPQI